MKSSLWIVIVLVTGIVGFLVGYSVSSSTGSANAPKRKDAHQAETAPGYGAQPSPAKPASAGGYR